MDQPYYHSKESVEEYIKLAKGVSGLEHIEKLKSFLPLGSSLLELGSGPGTDFNLLKKEYKVVGSDNSDEFLEHLQRANPNDRFLNLDATTLTIDEKFNGIYSNKVLHHLTDEELCETIKRQHEILKSDGIICHTFWVGEGTEEFKGMFVNYHKADELRDIFENYFEINLLESYREFEKDDSLLLIATVGPKGN